MEKTDPRPGTHPPTYQRVIARVRSDHPGPAFVGLGGMHGNEPAGIRALARVANVLAESRDAFRGSFLALSGNIAALEAGKRFLSNDLNRLWMPETISELKARGETAIRYGEEQEQLELLQLLEESAEFPGDVFVLDLHTTSVDARPFAVAIDDDASRSFAANMPIPVIIGLTRHLDGTIMEYAGSMGLITMAVEGGQHDSPKAPDWLEAATWLALDSADMLTDSFSSRLSIAERTLSKVARGPRELEVRYRHAICPEDEFVMEPGFENFQKVGQGQLLAHDKRGEIRSPSDGRILMPLYQNLGEEGFFIGRVCAERKHWTPFKTG